MTRKLTFTVLSFGFITLLFLTGCQMAGVGHAAVQPTPTPKTDLILIDPTTGESLNPFLPAAPEALPDGPLFPTATPQGNTGEKDKDKDNASSSGSSNSGAVEPLILPDDQVNILLLGSDQRPYEGGFRTDVILLVSVNLDSQTINMVSFPRDLYVTLPGFYNDRINAAMYRGGFQLLANTLEYNFGVKPDYYGMIHLNGFKSLINALGGINVQVGRTLSDQRTGYGTYTVSAGSVHMDGDTALWYVRSRKTTSDFDRTRRQQEVVTAIARRLVSLDAITKFPQLYNEFKGTIQTNLPLSEITPLLPLADEFMSGTFGSYAIGPSHVTSWTTPSGAAVLLPNKTVIRNYLKSALNAQ